MDVSKKNAIKRFLARSVDYLWFTTLLLFLLSSFDWNEATVIYIGWIVFIPIEAMFIAQWNATPGKALLGMKVSSQDGSTVDIGRSLARSTYVWVYGFWLGIPVLSFFANLSAYNDCTENGNTIWDRKTELVVG